jgi:hypothetical protein
MSAAPGSSDAGVAVEETHLARLEAYLSSLPGGLSAYPECQAKGILVRLLAAEERLAGAAHRLPHPFRRLVEDQPMGSEWIPEVHYQGLIYALADAAGLEDDAILASVRARDRRMFESPTYRLLMMGSAPSALVRAADLRWANWHRGSTLEVEGIADDGVRLAVRFPRGLFDGLQLRIFAESFLAALDLAQARAPRVEIMEAGAGFARYLVAWER